MVGRDGSGGSSTILSTITQMSEIHHKKTLAADPHAEPGRSVTGHVPLPRAMGQAARGALGGEYTWSPTFSMSSQQGKGKHRQPFPMTARFGVQFREANAMWIGQAEPSLVSACFSKADDHM